MSKNATTARLVIFDVCDTLYDANTTVGFIEFYQSIHGHGRIARTLRRWLSRRSPLFYLGAATQRLLGWDVARQRIIAALAGEPRAQLTAAANRYVREVLPASANRELHDRLKVHRAAGDPVLLLSSSLDVVIAEIASLLGTEYRASILDFDGEFCTGRLALDLTGSKASHLPEWQKSGSSIWVYTDNRSDRDLISLAERVTIILPRGKPDDRWAGDGHEYVRL